MLYSILVSIDVLIAAALIALVLLQQGKGATAGVAFGGGGGTSGSLFGAKGASSFMSRATAILAAAFFINSIVLAYLASNRPVAESIMDSAVQQEQQLDIPAGQQDVPNVVNVPEGASSEEMMDIIKSEIEKAAAEKSSEATQQVEESATTEIDSAQTIIEENAEQALPSDIPQ